MDKNYGTVVSTKDFFKEQYLALLAASGGLKGDLLQDNQPHEGGYT